MPRIIKSTSQVLRVNQKQANISDEWFDNYIRKNYENTLVIPIINITTSVGKSAVTFRWFYWASESTPEYDFRVVCFTLFEFVFFPSSYIGFCAKMMQEYSYLALLLLSACGH